MTLAENLKLYRRKEGLSQEVLAEYCQVSRQAIAKWENGESLPTIKNLIFLADFYKISLDELVGRKTDIDILIRLLHRFIAADVKFGENDDALPVICRFLDFTSKCGLSSEDALRGFKEIFVACEEEK